MQQSASAVLMVEPTGFAPDDTTAADNAFQLPAGSSFEDAEALACVEFRGVVSRLRAAGVEVEVVPGDASCPDAVFLNNWFSTHSEGRLVLYPMRAESRRRERRPVVVDLLRSRYPNVLDMTAYEAEGRFLEGTGSMVLDRRFNVAYAGRSPRTDEGLVREWCERMGYEPILFDTFGPDGKPIYHTNVLMSIGTDWAIVCPGCMSMADAQAVVGELKWTGRKVIEIDEFQMGRYGANVLELRGSKGPLVAMSSTAQAALSDRQLDAITWFAELAVVDVPTIETVGGGGVRCMLAELW